MCRDFELQSVLVRTGGISGAGSKQSPCNAVPVLPLASEAVN